MNLPNERRQQTANQVSRKVSEQKPHKQTWVAVLSIFAIVFSLLSAGFSAFVYFNTPLQIHNYVQSHKNELKGEDGRDGIDGLDGMNGRNGTNSFSPTRCSSYDYGYGYSSTNCY